MTTKNHPGVPYPLGATLKNEGVNFALYANKATKVVVCLFKTLQMKQHTSALKCRNARTRYGILLYRA